MNLFQRLLSLFNKKKDQVVQVMTEKAAKVIEESKPIPKPELDPKPQAILPQKTGPSVDTLKLQKYPGTKNWGDWRDVQPGESPEEYYARTGLAGYGATQEQLVTESNERNKTFGIDPATGKEVLSKGPLNLDSLTDDDCAYLVAMGEFLTFDPRNSVKDVPFFSVAGKRLAIDTYQSMPLARFDPIGFEQSGRVSQIVIYYVKDMAKGSPEMTKQWNLVHSGGTAWLQGRPVHREAYNQI